MIEKPKPCPLCGHKTIICRFDGDAYSQFACEGCGVVIVFEEGEEEAIHRYNERCQHACFEIGGWCRTCVTEGERRAFARIEAVMKKYECGFDYCEDSNDFWFDYPCNETVIRAASFQEALERAEALEKAEEEG